MTIKTLIINNLDFSQKEQHLQGGFTLAQCQRLLETLQINTEEAQKTVIDFELTGHRARFSQPNLQLTVRVNLPAICQRCLDSTTILMDLHFNYLISEIDAELPDDDDEIDWLAPNHELDLIELIEDELLMAVPIAPAHPNDCSKLSRQSGEKLSPFAVLKGKIS